jgi:hypothetical protein
MEMVHRVILHKAVRVDSLVVEVVGHGTMPQALQQLAVLAQFVLFGEQVVHSRQQTQAMYSITNFFRKNKI